MNEQNAEYLKERLFYLGFGDKLNADLEKNIRQQTEQFKLPIQAEFTKAGRKDVVEFSIDFSRSKQSDMYFLNSYHATLRADDPANERAQTFYINKGNGVTAKEAYNLLDGRAVYKKLTDKEGNPYEAWLQLNFDQKEENGNNKVQKYHTAWGYDLGKALDRHPVKEAANPDQRKDLIKSLEKGNTPQVTFQREAQEEKMFLAANPKERNLIVYDSQMKRQFQGIKEHIEEKTGMKEGQGRSEDSSRQKKADKTVDDPDAPAKKPKKKGMSV